MKTEEPEEGEEAAEPQIGEINKESFCDVCSLVQNAIWVKPKNSFLKESAPGIWNSGWFQLMHQGVWEPKETPYFDEIMDTVLLFNMIFILDQSMSAQYQPPHWMNLTTFFTLIYVGEVAVKLSVKSWGTYWSDPSNQFDFFTTWLLFGTMMLKYINIASLQQDLQHYANILRLLRLLRVAKKLKKYPKVKFMVTTVVRMVEKAGDILALLAVCLFFFSTFSVNFFGGLLYEGNPKLEDTEYDEKHWYVFNFNDVLMGFTTWFTQLLCEYSPEWADALWRVSAFGWISWYIYPIFYLFGVAIVFEILKAFTIETYLALKEESEMLEAKRAGEEESEDESESEFDPFEDDNVLIEDCQENLAKSNKSLHYSVSLLPALQRQIVSAWKEKLEEEGEEGSKKSD